LLVIQEKAKESLPKGESVYFMIKETLSAS